jgi:O-antigen/teichoic acid export membrane protein
MGAGIALARALPPSSRGVYAVMLSAATIGSVFFTAGGDNATLRTAGAGHLHAAVVASWSRVAASALFAVAASLVSLLLPQTVLLGLTHREAVLALAPIPLFVASQLLGNCLLGAGRMRRWSAQTMVMAVVYLIASLGVFAAGLGTVVTFMLCFIAGYAASVALMSYWFRHGDPKPAISTVTADFSTTARKSAASTLAQLVFLRAQAPMLQVVSTSAAVGLLAVVTPIAELLLMLPVVAGTVLVPHYTRGRPTGGDVRRHALRVAAATLVGAVVIGLASPWAIPFVYGSGYADATPVLLALLPGVVLFAAARTVQSYLVAEDRFGAVTTGAIAAVVVSLAAQMVLAPRLGATGAAIAISIGYAVAALPLWFAIVAKDRA